MKSDCKPILKAKKVDALLEAILLPSSIAVCKCPSHVDGADLISAGNAHSDAAAKVAARSPVNYLRLFPQPLIVNQAEIPYPSFLNIYELLNSST